MKWVANVFRSRKQSRISQLAVENLEGRLLLYATTPNHFSNNNITISFAPDGTAVAGTTTNLVSTFNQTYGSTTPWQRAIEDAAAWWETYANINFTIVSDNGAPLGSGNYQQGNPNFGDIRIGGYALPQSTLAFTIAPPPANGDSSSGDIMFNTAAPIGTQGGYDLESIAIHEFGHALGLGHSSSSSSVMYATYQGTKNSLIQDDINGVQAIYGARVNDAYSQAYNASLSTAPDISNLVNQWGQIGIGNLDLLNNPGSPLNSSIFKVTTTANASNQFAAIVQSTNWSLLAPAVAIYSSSGKMLSQNMGNIYTYGGTMGTMINNATPNTTYYIQVTTASFTANGSGNYGLLINEGNYAPGPVNPTTTTVATKPNQSGGTIALKNGSTKTVDQPDFTHIGALRSSGDDLKVAPAVARQVHAARVHIGHHHPVQSLAIRQHTSGKHHLGVTF